ncbi:RNA-binding protein 39 isoform X3 [Centruroides vittatus]|uniref:RNA-binding protein 39 isoform X3 n=2 Tax=Centruroides vittatus TaxID=120091 RepID=UPI00350F2B98
MVLTMSDDLDVEAMLEAPYSKGEKKGNSDNDNVHNEDEVNGRLDDSSTANKENRRKSSSSKKKKHSRSRSRSRGRRSRSRSHGRRSRSRGRTNRSRRSRSRGRRSRSRGRRSSRSRERRRHSRSHSRTRDRRRSRSRSRDRRHASRERRRSRSRSPRRDYRRRHSISKSPVRRRSPSKSPLSSMPSIDSGPLSRMSAELNSEDKDQRTVFCMQLSQRVRTRDLEEFFSSVGKVCDVRIIMDNKTRRSKGIAYIEFASIESVPLALGLNGQKLLGVPIIVQPTQAEKNRLAASANNLQKGNTGPMRLYVGSLHFNITEDMLRGIFEPFGRIDKIELIRDSETGRSKGYGFITSKLSSISAILTFHDAEDAKKALEQLNGFELAGRPMKVGHVTERTDTAQGPSFLDSDELDRTGIDLGATGRLQLMAKLAEGTGFEIPQAAVTALQMTQGSLIGQQAAPPIATQCFMLSNMFDPTTETNPTWDEEIKNDVVEECRKHGGALHVFVDKISPQGNVYVKCQSIAAAVASVNALHGRWFAGRVITAAYVPVVNYHSLFPAAITASTLL